MGYNTTPALIEQNEELLDKILAATAAGREIKLRASDGEISSEQYKLRRVLAATDSHRSFKGGKFAGLGQRVLLKLDTARNEIIVKPKRGVSIEEYRANENDALSSLRETSGSMAMLEFYPSDSFSLDYFCTIADREGWTIVRETLSEEKGGKISIAAERKQDSVLSDFL
jgi:hypothetical protein